MPQITVESLKVRSNTSINLMTLDDGSVFVLSIAAAGHLADNSNTADVLSAIQMVNGGQPIALPTKPLTINDLFKPQAVPQQVAPPVTPKVVNEILKPQSRPMTKGEMLEALKKAGVKAKGLHLCGEAKLVEKMNEAKLPLYTNGETEKPETKDNRTKDNPPAPQQRRPQQAPPAPQQNGSKPKSGGGKPQKKDDKPGEIVFIGENAAPLYIWRKDKAKVFPVYIVEEVTSEEKGDGWKVVLPARTQPNGLQAGYVSGNCWRVYSCDLPTDEEIAKFAK